MVYEFILTLLGWSFLLLSIVAYLGKKLIEKLISQDVKRIESELQLKTNSEIERVKSELQLKTNSEIERVKIELQRNLEIHKSQLKNAEFLFPKKIEAAKKFDNIFYSIIQDRNNPDMDYSDACDEIAHKFEYIEKNLIEFRKDFSILLIEEEKEAIENSINLANSGKFMIDNMEVSREANDQANDLYMILKKFKDEFANRITNQSSNNAQPS